MVVGHSNLNNKHYMLCGTNENAWEKHFEVISKVGKYEVKLSQSAFEKEANAFYQTTSVDQCVDLTFKALPRRLKKMPKGKLTMILRRYVRTGTQVMGEFDKVLRVQWSSTVATNLREKTIHPYFAEWYANRNGETLKYLKKQSGP